MAARLATDVLAYNPSYTIFMGGANNLSADDTTATITTALQGIYNQLLAAGSTVVACTMLPRTGLNATQTLRQHEVNRWICQTAQATRGMILCDWYHVWADAAGAPITNYTVDGLHPTGGGASILGRQIATVLSQHMSSAGPYPAPGDTANLINTGAMQAGTTGTVDAPMTGQAATGWRVRANSGTPNAACAKVARTDGLPGEWTQITIAGSSDIGYYYQQTVAAGDVLRATIEFETSSIVGATSFSARIHQYNAPLAEGSVLYNLDAGVAIPAVPASGNLVTPDFTVPTGFTSVRVTILLSCTTGVLRVGRSSLRKLN